jgi:arsenate reductase-like glutaredoxin family protein
MAAKPSADDMRLAASWLDEYEDSPEGDACKRVAEWLAEQADAKELRDAAREHGVPVKALRKKIAAQFSADSAANR